MSIRRVVHRKHRNKWLAGGFVGILGSATSLTPLLQGHVPVWAFAILTVGAFALAGISQVMGDAD